MKPCLSAVEPLLDGLGLPAWIKDPSGRYLAVGEGLARHLGTERAGMRGKAQDEFWAGPEVDQFRADDRAALARGRAVVVPEHAGTGALLVTVKVPLRDGSGRPAGTLGAFASGPWAAWERRAGDLHARLLNVLGASLRRRGLGGFDGGLDARYRRTAPLAAPGVQPWLEEVRRALLADFRRPRTICELAREAGVHPGHLGRAFRRAFGVPLHAYVRRLRVEWACVELARSSRPAGEIGLAAGFADQSHFTRCFRRVTRKTPGAYRRSLG